MAAKVLICDNTDGFRLQLQAGFERAGLAVASCASWEHVADAAESERPDAILADLGSSTFDVEQLVRVRQVAPDAILAVLSPAEGNGSHNTEEGIGGIDVVLSRRAPLERIVEELAGRLDRA